MTADTAMPAPGIWQKLWRFLQAAEMSSAEVQEDRIDALRRRVAALEKTLADRASAQP